MSNEYNEPEFPKSNTPRKVKITYSITGEVEIRDMGDEYVSFDDKDQQDSHDTRHFIKWFQNKIKTRGLKDMDYNIVIRSKDMDDDMFNEVTNTKSRDNYKDGEKPF